MNCNNHKEFNDLIFNSPDKSDSVEVLQILNSYPDSPDFYTLCQCYLDIALNLILEYDPQAKDYRWSNRHSDVNKAISVTKKFVTQYSINNYSDFLDMIIFRYRYSKAETDVRSTDILLKDDPTTYVSKGFWGGIKSLYDIDQWATVKQDVINSLP